MAGSPRACAIVTRVSGSVPRAPTAEGCLLGLGSVLGHYIATLAVQHAAGGDRGRVSCVAGPLAAPTAPRLGRQR